MVDVLHKEHHGSDERGQPRHLFISVRRLPHAMHENRIAKGNVFAAAKIAGIMAAKRCSELIPLCHSLPLDGVTGGLSSPVRTPGGW